MSNLNLAAMPETVNTFATGETVAYHNADGRLIFATVATDRGGATVRIKVSGFSSYIARERLISPRMDWLSALALYADCITDWFSLSKRHACYIAMGWYPGNRQAVR